MTSSAIYLTVNDDFEFNHSHSQSHSQSQLMQRTESKSINQNNYEEKVIKIGIHLAWMAHHKHMAAICPNIFNKNKRFDYNDDSYFESFHEIVTILKTIIDDNGDNGDNARKNILQLGFDEINKKYPHMIKWINFVQNEHFEQNEDMEYSWPFWPIEFIYIARLDNLLKSDFKFMQQFYLSDPLLYYGRCPCKQCGINWLVDKKIVDTKPRIICVNPIFIKGIKYLKENFGSNVYDSITYQYLGQLNTLTK